MPSKEMLAGFEFYEKTSRRKATEPNATITQAGTLSLNVAALKELTVQPKHVHFGFNKAKNILGILFLEEPDQNSYKVRFSASGAALIGATPALAHYGIDHSERRVFTPEIVNGDFVCIHLTEEQFS